MAALLSCLFYAIILIIRRSRCPRRERPFRSFPIDSICAGSIARARLSVSQIPRTSAVTIRKSRAGFFNTKIPSFPIIDSAESRQRDVVPVKAGRVLPNREIIRRELLISRALSEMSEMKGRVGRPENSCRRNWCEDTIHEMTLNNSYKKMRTSNKTTQQQQFITASNTFLLRELREY